MWGVVLDPQECTGGCASGGAVSDIWIWSQCQPGAPATLNDIRVELVDALGCPTSQLWHSGPVTVYSCVSGNHWTHISVPAEETQLGGEPFAVLVEFGPASPAAVKLGSDSGISNLRCWQGYTGVFPGCLNLQHTCAGWGPIPPPQVSYMFASDWDGDTVINDICADFGHPYGLEFPFVAGYGYMPNNLMIIAGLDCQLPASVGGPFRGRTSSWGRVKALYE